MYTVTKRKILEVARQYAPQWMVEPLRSSKSLLYSAISKTTYRLTAAGGYTVLLYGCPAGMILEYRVMQLHFLMSLDWEDLTEYGLIE